MQGALTNAGGHQLVLTSILTCISLELRMPVRLKHEMGQFFKSTVESHAGHRHGWRAIFCAPLGTGLC